MQKKIEKKGGEGMKKTMLLLLVISHVSVAGYAQGDDTMLKEPTVLEFKLSDGKLKPGKIRANSYLEFEKDGRIYAFISPKKKADFEKSGEIGVAITKIGYGPNGETVVFDTNEAMAEYDKRHEAK
jgi:hypothetical protein